MATFAQGFADARTRARQGVVGDWVYTDPTRRQGDGLNAYPQAVQVSTVVLTDPGDSTDVTITINGVAVTVNTGTGLAAAAIGALLATAINAEPLVRGQVRATFDTVTLTLTGLIYGTAGLFTVANTTAASLAAPTTVTAAASASAIPFGRAVVFNGYNPGYPGNIGETERLVTPPLAAFFTAQVITSTIAYVSGAVIRVDVYEVRGGERVLLASVNDASATSADATIDALVVLLNAALPAATVLAAADNATATAIIFTAEVPGTEIEVEVTSGSEGASVPAITTVNTTGPSVATSLARAWQGVSLYSPTDIAATATDTDGSYAANVGVKYAIRGVVWVACDETVTAGQTVYVETAAGANLGKFYAASSATRIALPRRIARWERDGLVSTDSLACIRLEA